MLRRHVHGPVRRLIPAHPKHGPADSSVGHYVPISDQRAMWHLMGTANVRVCMFPEYFRLHVCVCRRGVQ